MDQDIIQEKIKARIKQLPQEVQDAITGGKLPEKFDAISKKFNLRIDQSGSLQLETLLIMVGLESPDDFVSNLITEAEMSREMALAVTEEVNTTILNSIRETLRHMEEIALAEEGVMKSTVDTKNTEAKTTELTRSETLKGIEDPATHANVPINLIQVPSVPLLTDEVHHSVAATAPAPANLPGTPVESPVAASFINTLLTTPSVSSTEVVQKKPAIDPYRETIE